MAKKGRKRQAQRRASFDSRLLLFLLGISTEEDQRRVRASISDRTAHLIIEIIRREFPLVIGCSVATQLVRLEDYFTENLDRHHREVWRQERADVHVVHDLIESLPDLDTLPEGTDPILVLYRAISIVLRVRGRQQSMPLPLRAIGLIGSAVVEDLGLSNASKCSVVEELARPQDIPAITGRIDTRLREAVAGRDTATTPSSLKATVAYYGTEEEIHSVEAVVHRPDGTKVDSRLWISDDFDVPEEMIPDEVIKFTSLYGVKKIHSLDDVLPIESCPCCGERTSSGVTDDDLTRRERDKRRQRGWRPKRKIH